MKPITNSVVRTIAFCIHYSRWVIAVALLCAALAGWYSVTHFSLTTDINQLISGSSPARQRELALEAAFPQFDTIIAVVNAPTPELVQEAARLLADRLSREKNYFRSVEEPGGGAFFAQNGLLFEPTDQLQQQMTMLTQAKPLVGVLAADPNLRGVIRSLQYGLLGVQGGKIKLDDMQWPMTEAADTLAQINAGKPAIFSWQGLVEGHAPASSERLRFLKITAVLDYSELQPGLKASEAIRQAAADLHLDSTYHATVRLTGPVPMNDDEFATIKENAALNAVLTIAVVLFILWMALRWWRIIFAVFVSLAIGLSITAALGLMMVGTLNLISVYFAVLFVGLGVDFGIQLSVRYRAERHEVDGLYEALLHSGRRAGAPLTLAALATAAGFLAFLPTSYKGLSELGLIAGVGMIIAFLMSITVLPALLNDVRPPSEPKQLGYKFLAPVDDFLERHRTPILIATVLLVLAASPLLYWLRFDFNPMNLRNTKVESVATYLQLEHEGAGGSNFIEALEPNLATADQVAAKLKALPDVARVTTLSSFIPDQQDQKLPIIRSAADVLLPALNPQTVNPPPADDEVVSMLKTTADALNRLAEKYPGPGAEAAKRLVAEITLLANAGPAARQRAEAAFVQALKIALANLHGLLTANEVTRENVPATLVSQWITSDGRARIEIVPKATDNTALRTFAHNVLREEPNATEGPISILEARRTVISAFLEAGAFALLSIAVLLWITLRRLGDVLLTLIPLIVAGVVTLEICVAIDMPLNFANIIALPLLLGVGVAFKIYYIMAWREGQTKLLQSVLTRAVTFSACTTATAFGSLYFSSDPGTSSMGKLLAISLLTTMTAAAFFQPVLMGKPRDDALHHGARGRSEAKPVEERPKALAEPP
jgi:uncharacterized protein